MVKAGAAKKCVPQPADKAHKTLRQQAATARKLTMALAVGIAYTVAAASSP